jgi:hypothetical protein
VLHRMALRFPNLSKYVMSDVGHVVENVPGESPDGCHLCIENRHGKIK